MLDVSVEIQQHSFLLEVQHVVVYLVLHEFFEIHWSYIYIQRDSFDQSELFHSSEESESTYIFFLPLPLPAELRLAFEVMTS